ncbi:hypothetical protein [Streptomyces sp. CBMA152]|uniref:hypothetical protein n=1 Tax=Streptomyces sp. CBMA152 TaxID=1896312 RepID=UPI0016610AA9|nr:hypothetical protein [Streptomyces sp. CBMA152]
MGMGKKFAVATATGVMTVAGLAATGGTAFAGTDGQQIVIDDQTRRVESIKIQGNDQHGAPATACLVTSGYETRMPGWWWRDYMHFSKWTDKTCGKSGGSWLGSQDEMVPAWMAPDRGDWYYIGIFKNDN